MTKKELVEILANMPDDARIFVWQNGTIHDVYEIEHLIKINEVTKENIIKIKGK